MPLGPLPPSKVGGEDPPLDPAGLSNRKNDEILEGPNIFNNQMGPMGQSSIYLYIYQVKTYRQVFASRIC